MDLFNKLCGMVKQEDDCECHKRLKDHLRECADYGKLPPIRCGCPPQKKKDNDKCDEECDEEAKEKCEQEEEESNGPPLCTGMVDAPKCCPGQNEFKIKVFVPKPDIPDTFRFECPPPVIYCPPPPCCPTKKDECPCEDECCSNLRPKIVVQRSDGLTCSCSNDKDCGCGPSRPPPRTSNC